MDVKIPEEFVCVILQDCAYTICPYGQIEISSQWITLPTQSCLFLYSFCANLQHSLFMWLIISFLLSHKLHLLFRCVLSLLALIWLVLVALFCADIRRDSFSLLRFPFLSHAYDLSCEMLLISHLKRPWSCFSSHFCFLVTVILLILVLFIWS